MVVTKDYIDALSPKSGDEIAVKRNRVTFVGNYARHDDGTLYLTEKIPVIQTFAFAPGMTKFVGVEESEIAYAYRELTEVRLAGGIK